MIDVISPYAPAKDILSQLAESNFNDTDIQLLRPKSDGNGFEGKSLKDVLETSFEPTEST